MNCLTIKNLKAAFLSAAFLFSIQTFSAPASSIDNIKNKVAELLATKQKDKAIQLVISYSRTERSRVHRAEASELLFNIGQIFMTKEAQEEYENSLNETLDNEKKSLKAVENCLKIENQNLDCLIQKARLYYRAKNTKNFAATVAEIKTQLERSTYENIFQLLLEKNDADFRNKQIIKNLPREINETTLFYLTLEIDRSFLAKNYSRVRELLIYADKHYSSWPDLIIFKNKLNAESSEKQFKSDDDYLNAYLNKCKSMSHSVSRKFRYDFDLCNRGKK